MNPDFVTKFIFNDTVIVEISSDYDETTMIKISDVGDHPDDCKAMHLEPDEIDLFISALTLYKNRILGGWKN